MSKTADHRTAAGSNFTAIAVLFLAAAVLSVIAYPEIFLTFKTSFILWNDYDVEYEPTFVLTNFLYQGGIQLWDFFGQMPYFHTYVTLGIFKFPNLITAITYYLIAPFSQDSGRLFHHVFAWSYLMSILFIRLTGIFLLLKMVTKNRLILAAGTVIFAVFFCPLAFVGGAFYRNYFPLGIYFVVRFFQGLQLRYLTASFLFLAVVMGSELLHGAYWYMPMHFLIISGIIWRLMFRAQPQAMKTLTSSWQNKTGLWVAAVTVLIMAPYAYIVKFGLPSLAFGQNDVELSRVSHPFDPQWYFHNPHFELGSPRAFFSTILNMQTVDTYYYLGLSLLFLAMAGLVLNRNKLKYLFGLEILFLWLLTFPREGFNIGLIAHWINVLTNPLKTIPRSPWLASGSILPYILMPLAVMGIESIYEIYRGKRSSGWRLGILGGMLALLVLNGLPSLPTEVRVYLIVAALGLVGGLAWLHFRDSPQARNFLVGLLAILAVLDVLLIVHQSKKFTSMAGRRPVVLDAAPQAGLVEYDFENPSLFVHPISYSLTFSYRDEGYLWFPHAVSSDMHHVINQGLNYTFLNGYNPRHMEFVKWLKDPVMLDYLKENGQWMFLAPVAIKAAPDGLSRITAAGLSRWVVEVDDPSGQLTLPDQWPANTQPREEAFQYSQLAATLDINDQSNYRLQGDNIIFTWHLPPEFPDHLASSFFPAEAPYLRFLVQDEKGQWHELQSTQGELIRPYTFDVQNIKKGDLKAAFPKNDFPAHQKCILAYPSKDNQGVVSLWRRQFDNLGLVYRAKRSGWLVIHDPYDPKWRISVDGGPVKYYRVDQSFIGFPLQQGLHRVLIQYWPHSPLRPMLLVSALLTTLGLLGLIFIALKWEEA